MPTTHDRNPSRLLTGRQSIWRGSAPPLHLDHETIIILNIIEKSPEATTRKRFCATSEEGSLWPHSSDEPMFCGRIAAEAYLAPQAPTRRLPRRSRNWAHQGALGASNVPAGTALKKALLANEAHTRPARIHVCGELAG